MTKDRFQIDRIYSQIDNIARKGNISVYEYYSYIDDIISNGNYGYFEQCMYIYYGIDVKKYVTIDNCKKNTWKPILRKTQSNLNINLKSLYDEKGVYQTALNFYTNQSYQFIGQIIEQVSYNTDVRYLIENKEFAKITGAVSKYVEAIKPIGGTTSIIGCTPSVFNSYNPSLTSEQNYLINYSNAIDYLLSDDYVLITGYWVDNGYWNDLYNWID